MAGAAQVLAQGTTPPAPGTTPPPPGTTPPAPSGGGTIAITNPLGCDEVVCVVESILSAIYRISIPIVSLMVLVGAFQIMTAAGNPEKVSAGRKTIVYAVVGFMIVLLASGVVPILKEVLGVQ